MLRARHFESMQPLYLRTIFRQLPTHRIELLPQLPNVIVPFGEFDARARSPSPAR